MFSVDLFIGAQRRSQLTASAWVVANAKRATTRIDFQNIGLPTRIVCRARLRRSDSYGVPFSVHGGLAVRQWRTRTTIERGFSRYLEHSMRAPAPESQKSSGDGRLVSITRRHSSAPPSWTINVTGLGYPLIMT